MNSQFIHPGLLALPPPRNVPRSPAVGMPPDGDYSKDPRRTAFLFRAREQTIPYGEIGRRWFPNWTVEYLRKWVYREKAKRRRHDNKEKMWQQLPEKQSESFYNQQETLFSPLFQKCNAMYQSPNMDPYTTLEASPRYSRNEQPETPPPARFQKHNTLHLSFDYTQYTTRETPSGYSRNEQPEIPQHDRYHSCEPLCYGFADSNQIVAPAPVKKQKIHSLVHSLRIEPGVKDEAWRYEDEINFGESQPPRLKNPLDLMKVKVANFHFLH